MNNPFAKNIKKPNETKKKKPNLSINNRYATDLSIDSSSSNQDNKPKYKVPAKIPPKKETKPVETKEEENTHQDPVNALFEDNKPTEDNVDDIFNQGTSEEPKIDEKKQIEEVNTNTEVLIDNSKNGNEDNNIVENNEEQIEHIKEDENNQVASLSPRSNESKEAKSIINEEEPEVNDINEVKDANGHEEQNVNEVISNIREEEKKEEVESPYIVDSNNNEEEIIKLKKDIMSLNNQLHVAKLKESSFEAECNQYKNQIKSQSEIISQYKLKEINEEKYKKEIEILKSTLTNKDKEIDTLKKENSTLGQHLQSLSSFIKEYIEERENNKDNEEEEQLDDQPNEQIEIPKQSDPAVQEIKETTNEVIEEPKEQKKEEVKEEVTRENPPVKVNNPPVIQKEVPKPKFKPKERNQPKTSLDDFLSNVESESVDNIFSKDDKDPLSKSVFD